MIRRTGIGASHAHIKARRLTHMSADVYSPERHAMMWNPVRHGHYHHVHHVAPLPSPQFHSPTQSITVGRSRFVWLAIRGRSDFSRPVDIRLFSLFLRALHLCFFTPPSLTPSHLDTFCSQPPNVLFDNRRNDILPSILSHHKNNIVPLSSFLISMRRKKSGIGRKLNAVPSSHVHGGRRRPSSSRALACRLA